ncbi:hypothetical protein DFJ73DRAFT_830578 [Zopfochytrium polystomum]|nr:hypothetical protein DFJ73DRAFT_830578 [Zopfochytrium polystomum]
MSFKNPFAASNPGRGVSTVIAKDTEPVNKEFRAHVSKHLQADLDVLVSKGWISDNTEQLIVNTLRSHNIELQFASESTSSLVSRDTTTSRRFPSNESGGGSKPPPLPSREPSSSYRPTPNPPSSSSASSDGGNPRFPGASSAAASAAASVFASSAAAAAPPAYQKAVTAAVHNPEVQRAAYSAATNPAVQKAAYGAATNPALQKAAFSAVSGAVNGGGLGGGGVGGGASAKKRVVAVADFESGEDGDLAFRVGDLITVLEDVDENWYRGELRGKEGIFPKNHVQ